MNPVVVVTGDLVSDSYLYQYPTLPSFYSEPSPSARLSVELGGAWYLKKLVESACGDQGVKVIGPPRNSKVGRSFTVLSPHPKVKGGKKGDQVWRIDKFFGCERPGISRPPEPAVPDPGIVLIDDLGLGFNRAETHWPTQVTDESGTCTIILKSSSAHGDNLLLKRLIQGKIADRLTVIVSAGMLRDRGASISQGLSWDRTIEETVREFAAGLSSQDLALCRRVVVRFGVAGVASFARDLNEGERRVTLERFLYHSEEMEGDWEKSRPGLSFGAASFVAAALTRHELHPASLPLYVALGNALVAARTNHEEGFGAFSGSDQASKPPDGALALLKRPRGKGQAEPAFLFFTAFPHKPGAAGSKGPTAGSSDLLRDLTGDGLEYVAAKATEVVIRGVEKALRPAPKARYGSFVTVDREEIERINAIRGLAEAYLGNPDDRRPLSVAVFGPPGSGKSFAIKQLAEVLFGEKREALTFNLSEFGGQGQTLLQEAFHRVRDASVQGRVPLVFWDEFDSDDLDWLKHFLAPMQDAEFRAGSLVFPIGRALFIFAGGTKPSFDQFNRSSEGDARFIAKKGPDFVSRLRGYIDIKGPNPSSKPALDPAHLIRRAVLLRSLIERNTPDLIDARTGQASVSPGVIRGLLRVERYLHGARSLESLFNTSRVRSARFFGPSQLPPANLLSLYVSADFMDHVAQGELDLPVIEALAEAGHGEWMKLRNRARDGSMDR